MYKLNYVLTLDDPEDAFVITTRTSVRSEDYATFHAIKMTVLSCESPSKIANYYEAVTPDAMSEASEEEFCQHFQEILDGKYENWRLVGISVYPARLQFQYCDFSTNDTAEVRLDLEYTRITQLCLEAEVPNHDKTAISTYWFKLDRLGTLMQVEYPHLRQRRVFSLSNNDPRKISITDIYDI